MCVLTNKYINHIKREFCSDSGVVFGGSGGAQVGQIIYFLQIVMLYIELMGMMRQTGCKLVTLG